MMPTACGSSVPARADHQQLAGAEGAGHLVRASEQAAEAAGERPERRGVGTADEAHRSLGGIGEAERHQPWCEREAAGVRDEQRAG